MKSSTAAETTSAAMEAASTAMESTTAMAAAALGECRRRRTKNDERKSCNENYRQGLLHFSPSNPTTRDGLAGTTFRRGHLRGSPPTAPSYTRAALRANAPPNTLLPTHYVRLFGEGSTAGAALKTTALGTKVTRKSPNSSSRIPE